MAIRINEIHTREDDTTPTGSVATGGNEFIEIRLDGGDVGADFALEVFRATGTTPGGLWVSLDRSDADQIVTGSDGAEYAVFTFNTNTSDAGGTRDDLPTDSAISLISDPGGTPAIEEFISLRDPDIAFAPASGSVTESINATATPTSIVSQVSESPTDDQSIQFDFDGGGATFTQQASTAGDANITANTGGNPDTICFTRGTLIATVHGEKLVEELVSGDMLLTIDGGEAEIRWVGKTTITPRGMGGFHAAKDLPILIEAGALGENAPARDLTVSPKHAILVEGPRAELMFDSPRVLACADALVNGSTIRQVETTETIEYFHILMDRHEVIFSEGVASESYRPHRENYFSFENREMVEALAQTPIEELVETYRPRFPLLTGAQTRALVAAEADWEGVAISVAA